jgi:hypothetical protein
VIGSTFGVAITDDKFALTEAPQTEHKRKDSPIAVKGSKMSRLDMQDTLLYMHSLSALPTRQSGIIEGFGESLGLGLDRSDKAQPQTQQSKPQSYDIVWVDLFHWSFSFRINT